MTARLENPLTKAECGRIGGQSYDEVMKARSRDLILAAKAANPPVVHAHAVTPRRAEQLREYFRNVTAIMESTLAKADKRVLLDEEYKATYPEARR